MSKTFDDFCRRKECKKPVALEVKPITMHDGSRKFAYGIEWHRPLLVDCFESGGYCGAEDTAEEALWECSSFMFRNMIGKKMVEFFRLATKLITKE
ncbi:MAG: hypothetical protein IJS15_08110 [Victivallales bacterium]|nr:hypothetical protein [Victivallales bacterium]